MVSESSFNPLNLPVYDPNLGEDKSIPLIQLQKNEFVVNEEAMNLLKEIEKPIAFLCICGKYRTGKSFLLNKVLLNNDGFSVSSTVNPCTKGLWLWKRPLKFAMEDKEELVVLIVDTEGLGAFDKDIKHDTKIVLLGLLLSSLMIYNTLGNIDENALNSLSLVVNIARELQMNNALPNEDQFTSNFPSFLWVLRDFSLQLKDIHGNSITAKQYLEEALAFQKGSSEIVEEKNRVRKLLKHFFTDRDCATLVRPVEDENNIQNLSKLPDSKLRKEFIEQLAIIKAKIRKKIKGKVVNGRRVNGAIMANLCEVYTETINKGKVPSIEDAWSYVRKAQCESALNEAQKVFEILSKEKIINNLPMSKGSIKSLLKEIKKEATGVFKDKLISELPNETNPALKDSLKKLKQQIKTTIYSTSKEHIQNYLSSTLSQIKANNYKDCNEYQQALNKKLNSLSSDIHEAPGYVSVESEILFNKVCKDTKDIMQWVVMKQEGEIMLLTQQLKAIEADCLNRKSELLKEQEVRKGKMQELEEQLMKYKTSEIIMEERSRSINAEIERQELRHCEEIKEYKKRIKGLEESLKNMQKGYEKQLQAYKEEYGKKEVEVSKTLIIQEQQLKYLQEKVNDSQGVVMSKDKEINLLTDRLKYLESEFRNGRGEVRNMDESSKVLEVENAVLKKQLEMIQGQILENKASYSSIIESMNRNLVEALQEKTTLTLENKELTLAIENTQQELTIIEGRLHKLKKYREVIHAAKYIECKGCLSSYTSNAFLTHVKMCQGLMGKKENFPTERGHRTIRNANFEQVLVYLLNRNIKLK